MEEPTEGQMESDGRTSTAVVQDAVAEDVRCPERLLLEEALLSIEPQLPKNEEVSYIEVSVW